VLHTTASTSIFNASNNSLQPKEMTRREEFISIFCIYNLLVEIVLFHFMPLSTMQTMSHFIFC